MDGQAFTCTADSGVIQAEFAIRKVSEPAQGSMRLEFTRSYTDVAGTESVDFYDWSTGSYPYGSWVTVLTTPISGTGTLTSDTSLGANPERFLDDEGTLYVRVTASGAGGSAVLSADGLRVRVY